MGIRILMIDDDVDDIFIFEEVLKETAPTASFSFYTDPRAALEFLRGNAILLPELLILDINMPVLNGREFLKLLKSDEQLSQIPVAIYSTSNSIEEKKRMLALGGFMMVTKPNRVGDIREVQLTLIEESKKQHGNREL